MVFVYYHFGCVLLFLILLSVCKLVNGNSCLVFSKSYVFMDIQIKDKCSTNLIGRQILKYLSVCFMMVWLVFRDMFSNRLLNLIKKFVVFYSVNSSLKAILRFIQNVLFG